jgi:glucosamine--fructose-6-phosphate aminotransferase (isomerizing)
LEVRLARKNGNKILAITNTLGSTITRESDYVIYTHCGPEIAVASTKAFTSQLAAIYVFAINFAYLRGNILITKARELSNELLEIPKLIKKAFSTSSIIEETIKELRDKNDYLYIARGINYPIALEGALKLKEISYLHAEGYAAGEMKHGPIAIIDEGMPVIAICVSDREFEFMRSNIEEVRARGGRVIGIVDEESKNKVKLFRYFEVPKVSEIFTPVLTVIPLQLFAYYTALDRNRDIDKPRNLAKSVTVK